MRSTWTIRRPCAAGCEPLNFLFPYRRRASGSRAYSNRCSDRYHVLKMLAANEPDDFGNLAFWNNSGREKVSRLSFLSCVKSVR